ncbi:hypothetical protein QJS10_CPA05g01946 [Acorus calamus]|uniref:PWI domain-containing protein n=1 Tax=Acorus calamus TaxID=4465 RepID=A0AAV9ESD1_ACOCL|nr:hypothetical protein QJS10_CPA05g01946 [Acorus calamus]
MMVPGGMYSLRRSRCRCRCRASHELQERMKPWISKKITELLGEEEPTLVDYIATSTKDHLKAFQMFELLQIRPCTEVISSHLQNKNKSCLRSLLMWD